MRVSVVLLVLIAGCGASVAPVAPLTGFTWETAASGLENPVWVGAVADDDALYVAEQPGRIQVISGEQVRLFLDISERVDFDTFLNPENGLLGVAFHPDYRDNGRLFVNYTDETGTVVAEYKADPATRVADSTSERVLLRIPQPTTHHNGGMVGFGPEGRLFVAVGDGGTPEAAQDTASMLGSILRIDVDGDLPYAIPGDNPFADGVGGAPEVFAKGLRNPWRFQFDGDTLVVGDVGEERREEIDLLPLDAPGLNLGWPVLEGSACFSSDPCTNTGLTSPAIEYEHAGTSCSVIAGPVYGGSAIPEIDGRYIFGDLCDGRIRSVDLDADAPLVVEVLDVRSVPGLVSMGVDHDGELYVALQRGEVLKLVAVRAPG
jgi:glucose/arabinose dehydrogenase